MVAKWQKNGLKHWLSHNGLLAQINKEKAIFHGWEISTVHLLPAMGLNIFSKLMISDVVLL